MSKLSAIQQASERKKTVAVGVVAALLAVVNFLPLHYSNQQNCPHGGTFTTSGMTMGLPMAYFRTIHGGINDCPGMVGDAPTKGFSAQWLVTDAMVFGVIMVGLNVLLDRRTAA